MADIRMTYVGRVEGWLVALGEGQKYDGPKSNGRSLTRPSSPDVELDPVVLKARFKYLKINDLGYNRVSRRDWRSSQPCMPHSRLLRMADREWQISGCSWFSDAAKSRKKGETGGKVV